MERRDWSLKALSELTYIDSLDSFEKADTSRRTFLTVLATASLLTPVKSMAEGAKKLFQRSS